MPDEIKQIRKEYVALKGLKKISNKEFAKELGLEKLQLRDMSPFVNTE